MTSRARLNNNILITQYDLHFNYDNVINVCNLAPGPHIAWDDVRKCYGLIADRNYCIGEKITSYGGHKTLNSVDGDYVAKASEVFINGEFDFYTTEKGRWINEYDRERSIVNVSLGRTIRAIKNIQKGEWLFADYGPEYKRTY